MSVTPDWEKDRKRIRQHEKITPSCQKNKCYKLHNFLFFPIFCAFARFDQIFLNGDLSAISREKKRRKKQLHNKISLKCRHCAYQCQSIPSLFFCHPFLSLRMLTVQHWFCFSSRFSIIIHLIYWMNNSLEFNWLRFISDFFFFLSILDTKSQF